MVFLCILGLLFLHVLHFIYYSAKIKDKYGLRMIVGQLGSGKSTIICALILKYMKKGWTIYADFETNIPGVRKYDPKNLDRFLPPRDSVLFIDEASLVFFSRNFATFNRYTEFFALCRHAGCRVYLSSQSFDVDLYIRNRCAHLYLIRRFGALSVMRRIAKVQTCLSAESLSNTQDVKQSGLIDGYKYAGFFAKDGIHFYWLPKYWKWHDSFYLPDRPELPYSVPVPVASEEAAELPDAEPEVDDSELLPVENW